MGRLDLVRRLAAAIALTTAVGGLDEGHGANRLLPHQLTIVVDYQPEPGAVEITYGYPHSRPHPLNPRTLRLQRSDLRPEAASALDCFVERCRAEVLVEPVRIPHGTLMPTITPGYLTVPLQDKTRNDLPMARMYFYEAVKKFGSQRELVVLFDKEAFPADLAEPYQRLRSVAKTIAWKDFQALLHDVDE